jgi:hypothetical protein
MKSTTISDEFLVGLLDKSFICFKCIFAAPAAAVHLSGARSDTIKEIMLLWLGFGTTVYSKHSLFKKYLVKKTMRGSKKYT